MLVAASTGQTTFDFTPNGGHDVVYGFHATGASHDWLSLQGYGFKSFADLQPHIVQQGSDTLVNLSPTDAVLLRGVQAGALTADDFLLPFNASGLKQTFAADFNGPLSVYDPKTGQGVFTTSFNGQQIESGPNAWRSRTLPDNGEKEIYVDPGYAGAGTKALGVNPFTISDGVLDITARRTAPSQAAALNGFDYTSGLLTTRESFSQLYGYFEIRAQLPVAQGAWPAFWLAPVNATGAEFDPLEQEGGSDVFATTHTSVGGAKTISGQSVTHLADPTAWHTYGLLWTAKEVDYYVDGAEVGSAPTPTDGHSPMYLIANLAVGGNWVGAANFNSADYKIDYIHAYSIPDSLVGDPAPITETIHVASSTGDHDLHGADTVRSDFTYSLQGLQAHNLQLTGAGDLVATANDLGDVLTGNAGHDTLIGGLGADTLQGGAGVATLRGGAGDDVYLVNNSHDVVTEAPGGGNDVVYASVDFTQPDNVEHLVGTNTGAAVLRTGDAGGWISGGLGPSTLVGGAGDDFLHAGAGDTSISGGAGDDTLQDGSGHDVLAGGAGDDRYVVDYAGSVVTEAYGQGSDTIVSSVSYHLPVNVEVLQLHGSGGDISAWSNDSGGMLLAGAGSNHLYGGSGADTLVDSAGADTLAGGGGADDYEISNPNTRVIEAVGGGDDTVHASVTYHLPDNVESLVLTGWSNIDGYANDGGDSLTGSGGASVHLYGGAGDDTLVTGAGSDTLVGGAGDDTYVVNPRSVVVEQAGGGFDTVMSEFNVTAPANVEHIVLTGHSDLVATAGATAVQISGNLGNDTLIGGAGDDFLHGGPGDDRLIGGAGDDTMMGGGGNDLYMFSPGGGHDDIIDFGAGKGHDVLDFYGYQKAGAFHPVMTQGAHGVLITLNADDSVYLAGVQVSDLHATANGWAF